MPRNPQTPPAFVQLIPVGEEGDDSPWAFYGLDAKGRLWFGVLKGVHQDGGHNEINWRLLAVR